MENQQNSAATLQQVLLAAKEALADAKSEEALGVARTQLHATYIAPLAGSIRNLPDAESKRSAGEKINSFRTAIDNAVTEAREHLREKHLQAKLSSERLDVFVPARVLQRARAHVLNETAAQLADFFSRLGFEIAKGSEVVSDDLNFTRLNMPKGHPARAMQESLYVDDKYLLRTHCTAVTADRLAKMKDRSNVRVVAFGNVYRNDDDDATHSHQFMQVDMFWVSETASLANLKWILREMCRHMFGPQSQIRMRPSFFPFTEPSFEVDVQCPFCGGKGCSTCKRSGWIEILGSGMLHPNVLKAAGRDPNKERGFAAGIGVERIAMLKHQIGDIRSFYANDLRFLEPRR